MENVDREELSDSDVSSHSSSSKDTPIPVAGPSQPEVSKVVEPQIPRIGEKRKAKRSKRKAKRRRETDEAIRILANQVSEIKNFIESTVAFQPTYHSTAYEREPNDFDVSAEVSRDLYSDNENDAINNENESNTHMDVPGCSFDLSLNTVLKPPSIPMSVSSHLQLLKNMHHFNSKDWDSVRYVDVQKQYCSSPGFTHLETNDEFKPYDKAISLASYERGFAAITQALIKQNEAAQDAFHELLKWSSSCKLITAKKLEDKINDVFVKGSFQKISNDVLQLTCGHRAEIIQQRRDNLLRSVKDSYLKASLRKIPPTCENLFEKDELSAAIEKAGGSNKIFWPPRAPTHNKSAAQAQTYQQTQAVPSYAPNYVHRVPSHFPYSHTGFMNRPPVQGPSHFPNSFYPQGRDTMRHNQRNYAPLTRPSRPRTGRNVQSYEVNSNTRASEKHLTHFPAPRQQTRRKY